MEFKSELINIRVGGKKFRQTEHWKNIMNLYDAQKQVIKFYKGYYAMIHDTGHDATYRNGLKILNPKHMF